MDIDGIIYVNIKCDYISSFLFQYLFPDAAVEKSSESSKTKTAHLNASGKAKQDKNADYVCLSFYATHWVFDRGSHKKTS